MRKQAVAMVLGLSMAIIGSMTAFAGQWEQTGTDWKYNDNGTYTAATWKWIDGKCYYFDTNGIMAKDTIVETYQVNADGQWVVNGVVQTQTAEAASIVHHNAGYDPAHPLAGKIDEWNLRLPQKYIGEKQICNNNVQAMLTGQMDQYFAAPVGECVDEIGNHIYTAQEDYDFERAQEQTLYDWFCNWLNGIDFENMSEMERAKEIQKVMSKVEFKHDDNSTKDTFIDVLINKKAACGECAMTATSLAKALGLKSAVSGTGDHAVYYIQVDGVGYFGQNNILNLDTPTPDYVYFQ